MRIHFRSALPCALRLGGAVAGYCGEADKFVDAEESVPLLAEFLPADGDFLPLSFILDEAFFASPPACCDVYLYDGGADVIAARFAPRTPALRPLAQGRAGNMLATVLDAGVPQAAIERDGRLELYALPRAAGYEISAEQVGGTPFLCLRAKGGERDLLCLFAEDLTCALRAEVTDAAFGEQLHTELRLSDLARHTVRRTFAAAGNRLEERGREVAADPAFDRARLHEKLLPFAFFQELAAGGDPAPYLAEELLPQAQKLSDYLGPFCDVVLPKEIFYLRHGERNAAGLVYRKAENRFEVKFFEAVCRGGRIANILPVP